MKASITLMLGIFIALQTKANDFYSQLCSFNYNWFKYENRIQDQPSRTFSNDAEYVQAHLESVLKILKSNPISHLSCSQYENREMLIAKLSAYQKAGKFPLNHNCTFRIPVFIDEHNTYCAVGYLLRETGHDEVAKSIAKEDNYVWVKDIKHPALSKWQEWSGLSMEEIMLIQGAYDFYPDNGLILVNRYDVPQKPQVISNYFNSNKKEEDKTKENIWLYGEGKNGVLQGKWIQNYRKGLPWIVGYYENGKRSGQWEEYYQGTKILCRTENWRDDKLNGIRKRFSQDGKLIEEIMFKDGDAITKTNYDFEDSLIYIRKPIDSSLVYTEVFTFGGALLASGHETVYNPSGLKWFQNIELTALNSAMLTTEIKIKTGSGGDFIYDDFSNDPYMKRTHSSGGRTRSSFYNFNQTPSLVEYKKEGVWKYYMDYNFENNTQAKSKPEEYLNQYYKHYGSNIFAAISMYDALSITQGFDSIRIEYKNDVIQNFFGYSKQYLHLFFEYHEENNLIVHGISSYYIDFSDFSLRQLPRIKTIGTYNDHNQKTGTWDHYDEYGQLYKKEFFIIPKDETAVINSN